jgi:hypothetical protein
LHKERFVIFQIAQGSDNRVERLPAPGGATGSTVNDKSIRGFGHVWVEIVHQHPHGRFLMPAFAASLDAARCVNDSFSAHPFS